MLAPERAQQARGVATFQWNQIDRKSAEMSASCGAARAFVQIGVSIRGVDFEATKRATGHEFLHQAEHRDNLGPLLLRGYRERLGVALLP